MSAPYDVLETENLTRNALKFLWRQNRKIKTCDGMQPIRKHTPEPHKSCGIIYRCQGCERVVCSCNGGTDDPRCDDCVMQVTQVTL